MKTVDTCAAEFEAHTPYHYSTYEDDDEVAPSDRPKIIIIGSGPNRIGQGVEFDYCCVQASFALHDAGYETVMVNCNPETVSTDYDTSDRLYFEPVTWEDVTNVIDVESATGTVAGIIVSLGGQTPLEAGRPVATGTGARDAPDSIDLAEDRERWNALWPDSRSPNRRAGRPPPSRTPGRSWPGLAIRPWCGRATCLGAGPWRSSTAMTTFGGPWASWPGLARSDARAACRRSGPCWWTVSWKTPSRSMSTPFATRSAKSLIGAVMEHVEEAGVHSGDSACVIPPPTLDPPTVRVIEHYTREIAAALEVIGPLNVQFAVKQLGGPAAAGPRCS